MDGRDLIGALRPVPVRQNVRHRKIRPPVRLVNVKAVLLETVQVNDAEIRTARRAVVRCRLAKIIETGPYKLTRSEGILLLAFELPFRRRGPRRRIEVVGTHLGVRWDDLDRAVYDKQLTDLQVALDASQ